MPYTPQTWTNDVSKLNATRMTYIEDGIDDAHDVADAAIPKPSSPTSDDGLFWNGSNWVNDKVDNAKVDAAAAIAVTKLAAGSDGQLLKTVGSTPTWSTVSSVDPIPTGTIMPYSASAAPAGYLLCDGAAVSRTTYSTLFALIGTDFGVGDGSSTFNVPNLKGKVPVGIDSGQTEFDTRGETGGAKTHTLTSSQMPAHDHSTGSFAISNEGTHTHGAGTYAVGNESGHTHQLNFDYKTSLSAGGGTVAVTDIDNQTGASPGTDATAITASGASHTHSFSGTSGAGASHSHSLSGSSGSAGSGSSHNNLQPYIALHYIIKT